jgi:hypothetical protein
MQTILLGRRTGGPRRTSAATRGAAAALRSSHARTRCKAIACEKRIVVIGNRGGYIQPRAVAQHDAGPLGARRPESNELHRVIITGS